jgi:hypothetical protein
MQYFLQMLQLLDARENMFNFRIWDNFTSLLEKNEDLIQVRPLGIFSHSIKYTILGNHGLIKCI